MKFPEQNKCVHVQFPDMFAEVTVLYFRGIGVAKGAACWCCLGGGRCCRLGVALLVNTDPAPFPTVDVVGSELGDWSRVRVFNELSSFVLYTGPLWVT